MNTELINSITIAALQELRAETRPDLPPIDDVTIERILELRGKLDEKFVKRIILECTRVLQTEMYRLDAIPGREVSAQTLETAQLLIKNRFGIQ